MDAMIYAVRCTANNRRYIGCTAGKLNKRFREHRCLLRAGDHKCRAMQADWTAIGEATFVIEPIEVFAAETTAGKREREKHWMHVFADQGLLYNENTNSYEGTPESLAKAVEASAKFRSAPGYRQPAEANLRRSLAQKGIPKGHGAKISATKRAKRAMR